MRLMKDWSSPYGPGVGAAFGLVGALVAAGINADKPRYEMIDAATATVRIQTLGLTSISPESVVFVRQAVYTPAK